MTEARRLLAEHPKLSTLDGVHLGVMWEHGIEDVSYDGDFSQVSWVKRLLP
jgi:predicted nucleic acid-binding protein